MPDAQDNGFSLIETLVALTVLAVSSSIILSSAEAHTATVIALKERTHARWVAQNRLELLRGGKEDLPLVVAMGGQDWHVTQTETITNDPDIRRVEVSVARSHDGTDFAFLTGFIAQRRAP